MPKNSENKDFAMKHAVSTKFEKYFASNANTRLGSYFGRIREGQPNVYTTPFAKGESTEELLQAWSKTLVSLKDEWPTLWEFEDDMAKKVGPLSVELPLAERLEDVRSYYDGILLPSSPISDRAIKAVISEWGPARGLQVRTQTRTVELMKKSTNSGSPYFTTRRNVLRETVPASLRGLDSLGPTQYLPGWKGKACAVLGWRGQEGGPNKEDVKQRVVWMFPFAVNIAELQVYQPLIEAAQRFDLIPAWVSMDNVDRRITKLFDTKPRNDLIVCTDFTKFDQHFNQSLQNAAKDIIYAVFTNAAEWLEEVYPIKYNIPIAVDMQDGYLKMYRGLHGMGSGSGGTNADESLAHRALQYEAAQAVRRFLNPNSLDLGDDGILTYPGIQVKDVVDVYSSHGLEMNMSKQYASSHSCIYLRRWHNVNYRIGGVCAGVYSTNRALGRLRYLERFMDPQYWSPEMVALRQLSIIENVKYHPLRDQFAEFCMKRDKYRLGIDIPGFLDNLTAKVQEANDHMPDFLGYTKTLQSEGDPTYGINSWWIVNYLKSRA